MRKGFLHVVETLIVIILVFFVISQFSSIPRSQHTWSTTKLTVMAQDLLYTMDEKGVDWFDNDEVNETLYGAIPETMGYSLVTWQTIRPVLKVGCVCNDQNFSYLDDLLQDMTVNGRYRDFVTEQIPPGSMDFDVGGSHLDNDVILFWGYPPITSGSSEEQNLSEYLSMGNGVVEYANLTDLQIQEQWHQDIFNIEESLSLRPSGDLDAEFNLLMPDEKAHEVIKIYGFFNPDDSFDNFGFETVYPVDGRENKIVLRQASPYGGPGSDQYGKSIPLVVVNWGVGGRGRSAWMSDGELTPVPGDKNSDLLKSLIVWAAGEKEYVVKDDVMAESSKASMRSILNTDIYEPVKIELTLGYHF